jgi:hypothetical protein
MWNGGPYEGDGRHAGVDPARIAASVLAAYTGHHSLGYPPAMHLQPPSITATYQSQAMEALRRQQQQQQLQYSGQQHHIENREPQYQAVSRAYPSEEYDDAQSPYPESGSDDESDGYNKQVEYKPALPQARGKPEALATAIARGTIVETEAEAVALPFSDGADEAEATASSMPPPAKKKKSSSKKKSSKLPSPQPSSGTKKLAINTGPSLDDPVAPITEAEYHNVRALMHQFCKVPLLSEFSRPVSLLHPEVSSYDDCSSNTSIIISQK